MFFILLTIVAALIAFAFYKLSSNNAQYFERQNIKYSGMLFGLQNLFKLFLGKISFFEMTQLAYNKFPNESIYGSFDFFGRQYVIRDPEMVKRIAIKDFEHFVDRRSLIDETVDELWGNSMLTSRGEKWRTMRTTLSPAFTGSKMRQMFELLTECADEVLAFLSKKAESGEKINIEMKDFFSKYTNDVIATCAFGVKVNSFVDPQNEFYLNGSELVNFENFGRMFKVFMTIIFPKITKLFRIRAFDKKILNTFKELILDTMAMRQEQKIDRPDMIKIMMQVRDGNLKHQTENETFEEFAVVKEADLKKTDSVRTWTDNEVVAQCLTFFFAGSEPTSSLLSLATYELIVNPDVQQKLYEEIAAINDKINGAHITYDALQKMKYLDQVVCETLRKYPSVELDRDCVKDYLYDDGKLKFTIEKGANVIFYIYGIHRDPKYYPEPEKFDPERFSDENKQNIVPGSYAPFGIGPRACIGSRFALMELKAILYYLLLNFSLEPNENTQIPLKMKQGPLYRSEKGIHLELKPRT